MHVNALHQLYFYLFTLLKCRTSVFVYFSNFNVMMRFISDKHYLKVSGCLWGGAELRGVLEVHVRHRIGELL